MESKCGRKGDSPFPKRGGKLRAKRMATGMQNPALTACMRFVKGVNHFTISHGVNVYRMYPFDED